MAGGGAADFSGGPHAWTRRSRSWSASLSIWKGTRKEPVSDGDRDDAGASPARASRRFLLEARDLGRRHPGTEDWPLRHVDLALRPGELVTIRGPTGSGKTLLLRSLAGLDPVDEGAVLLHGRRFEDWEVVEFRRRVVYLHQFPALVEGSVAANLRLPFRFRVHRGADYDRERAHRLLGSLGWGPDFQEKSVENLSGGERQVTALLRALLIDPDVLLLDEPTAALDPEATGAIEQLVGGWLDEGSARAVVWVTHGVEQARRVSRRRLRLRRGRLEPSDPAASRA